MRTVKSLRTSSVNLSSLLLLNQVKWLDLKADSVLESFVAFSAVAFSFIPFLT